MTDRTPEEEAFVGMLLDYGALYISGKDEDGNEVSMSKGDFKNYMAENPDADLTGSKFYKSKLKDMSRIKDKYTPGLLGKLRRLGMGPLRNLETYVSDLSKGSRKMRDWMSKKVDEISFASLQKLEEAYYLKRDIIKGLDEIFGTAGGFSNSDLILNQKSGIQSDAGTENATDLTNGEILDIYNLSTYLKSFFTCMVFTNIYPFQCNP